MIVRVEVTMSVSGMYCCMHASVGFSVNVLCIYMSKSVARNFLSLSQYPICVTGINGGKCVEMVLLFH